MEVNSRDSIARLNAFSADPQYCAGKIAVASDPAEHVQKALAAVQQLGGNKSAKN